MSSEEPFGPWVEPMERAGARNPRARDGRISWGGLARKAGVSTSAITNMVYGRTKTPSAETVQKVAAALSVAPEEVSAWLKLPRPVGDPYIPDGKSSLLHEHERSALDELIRAITRDRGEVGGEREHGSTPKTPAGVSPAHVTGDDEGPVELAKQDEDSTVLVPVEQLHPTAPAEVELPQAARRFPPGGSKKQQLAAVQDGAEHQE